VEFSAMLIILFAGVCLNACTGSVENILFLARFLSSAHLAVFSKPVSEVGERRSFQFSPKLLEE